MKNLSVPNVEGNTLIFPAYSYNVRKGTSNAAIIYRTPSEDRLELNQEE